jgi:hypothetical protein
MTKAEFQKELKLARLDGWNMGVRKAARLAGDCWVVGTAHREQAEETEKAILKLVKPYPKR